MIGFHVGINLVSGSDNIYLGTGGGTAKETKTIRLGAPRTRAFVAGIRGMSTGLANAVSVMIDSNGQLGTVNSSARFEEDIHDMDSYSRGRFDLRPVTYRYKELHADRSKPLEPGLIAGEVTSVDPDLVAIGSDGRVETVQSQKPAPMPLNELQRQQRTLKARSEQADAQSEEITKLVAQTRALEARSTKAGAEARWSRVALAEQNANFTERLAKLETAPRELAAVTAR